MMGELKTRHADWCKRLQQAVQADTSGQVLEAVEAYESLAEVLLSSLPICEVLPREQRLVIDETARSLELRAKTLSSVDGEECEDAPSSDEMEDVLERLCQLMASDDETPAVFPLDRTETTKTQKDETTNDEEADEDDQGHVDTDLVTINQPLHRPTGATYLDIQIHKVGLKDASSYVNPTIVVSVHDKDGKPIESTARETSVGSCDEPQYISFGTSTIQLETSVEAMEARGGAVFFEVYHYKTKKRKKSCRCWALLELDEIKPGPLALELYQKPMDPKRKRVHLFTVKDLFLHIHLTLQAV